MTVKTYEIEIDLGIDENKYKPVAYRPPHQGEYYLAIWDDGGVQLCYNDAEYFKHGECRIIVELL